MAPAGAFYPALRPAPTRRKREMRPWQSAQSPSWPPTAPYQPPYPSQAWAAPADDDDDPDAPAMMEPGIPAHENEDARPSLLAFRNSRVLRATQRQSAAYKHQLVQAVYGGPGPQINYHPHAPPGHGPDAAASGSEDDWYESSEDTEDERASPLLLPREHTLASTVTLDDGSRRDDPANYSADGVVFTRDRRATTITAYMEAPPSSSGSIPILDDSLPDPTRRNNQNGDEDEDDVVDVDSIVCDPSRLPRTMVVDENGFSLSRESLLVSAAAFNRSSVIKTGLLFKQGTLRGRLVPSGGWKVRFAALSASKLSFFREENGRKRGEINLLAKGSAKCVIEVMPKDSVFDGASATMWRFAVRFGSGNGRRVLLAAYTEAEMKDWLRCLHVALAVAQGAGAGRFTDVVVPSGTFLAGKRGGGGPLRASGFH